MKINNLNKYSYFLGLIILGLILTKTDFYELKNIFSQIKINYFIFASFLAVPMLLNKAWCWQYLAKRQNINYSLKNSFLMYGSGIFLGSVTPGKIGDFAKIFYLKKDGYSPLKGFIASIVDRFLDLSIFLSLGVIGFLIFVSVFKKHLSFLGAIGAIVIIISIILLKDKLYKKIARKMFYKIIPQKYQKNWKINITAFFENLKRYKLKHYLTGLSITFITMFFYFLQMKLLAISLNINQIPFIYLIFTVSIAGLISLVPISIAGIGTRDAVLIIIFSEFLISKELAIVFSTSILLMTVAMALVGFVCYLIKPLRLSTD